METIIIIAGMICFTLIFIALFWFALGYPIYAYLKMKNKQVRK
jgi:type IV secretory pathway TrbD component